MTVSKFGQEIKHTMISEHIFNLMNEIILWLFCLFFLFIYLAADLGMSVSQSVYLSLYCKICYISKCYLYAAFNWIDFPFWLVNK